MCYYKNMTVRQKRTYKIKIKKKLLYRCRVRNKMSVLVFVITLFAKKGYIIALFVYFEINNKSLKSKNGRASVNYIFKILLTCV